MAITAPITAGLAAQLKSWFHNLAVSVQLASTPIPRTIDMTIVDLRLILRRIDHLRREHVRCDARYLGQTITRSVIRPLDDMDVPEDLRMLCHGVTYALRPVAGIGQDRARSDVDIDGELDEAAALLRSAIARAEGTKTRPA
jgi:hypothetical protein